MLVKVRHRQPDDKPHAPTVLIVDDEPDILESLSTYLELTMPGTIILTASSAEQALPIIAAQTVDVIVSDLRMPGMDGLTLLGKVRKEQPAIRRILITAFNEADLSSRARDAGVGALLQKPFPMAEFRETVAEALAA